VQASEIAKKIATITENAPRLIAVVGELVAVDNFKQYFVGGDVYLDVDNSVKRALGGGTIRTMSFTVILSRKFWAIKGNLEKKHSDIKEGNFSTNGLSSGGVVVVSKDGEMKYLHLETVSACDYFCDPIVD
jgi:hypothetical protein